MTIQIKGVIFMVAKYFYNKLLNYDEENEKTRKRDSMYRGGMINIHHKNDETTWFTILKNGNVWQQTVGTYETNSLYIDDLEGDDFELFNIVQVVKSGYLVLNAKTESDINEIIYKLYCHIDLFDTSEPYSSTKDIPLICYGFFSSVSSSFSYRAINDMELHIKPVKELCKENINRKYYGLHCFPFIRQMSNESSIYVSFVQDMQQGDYKETYNKCNEALSDLLSYMKEINVDCKWVECKMQKSVYL